MLKFLHPPGRGREASFSRPGPDPEPWAL